MKLNLDTGSIGCPVTYKYCSIPRLFVARSITAGALSSNREKKSYPAQLQRLLGSAYSVSNFGSSGATLMRTPAAYIKRGPYKRFIAEKWDIVVIMLGTQLVLHRACHCTKRCYLVCRNK